MKNILNIIKYNNYFRSHIISIICGAMGLIISLILTLVNLQNVEYANIPIIATTLFINLIESSISFLKSYSKESGRGVFLFPIRGYEFLLSKYIEFIVFQFGFATLVTLISCGGYATGIQIEFIALSGYALTLGILAGFIIITSIISIVSCYFYKTFVRILLSLAGIWIFSTIVKCIQALVEIILPDIYITINGNFTIFIFKTAIMIGSIVGIVIIAMKHIDNVLEIK